MPQLWPYQERCIPQVSQLLAGGHKSVLLQGATGVGKTAILAAIAQRFNAKSQQRVLILVHRTELVLQTRRTLFDWYNINAQAIDQDCKRPADRPVYVGMCETVFRRLSRNHKYLPEIGMVIYDEAHRGEFKKLHALFPDALAIGFTATPLSSSKKDPLKNYYTEIVCAIDIPELIEIWKQDHTRGLVQNRTYAPKNVDRDSLRVVRGEFDEHQMGIEFSKTRHVLNTVKEYTKHCDGAKAIVYNVNVAHSKLVCDAFVEAGYPCRHLDASMGDDYRKDCLRWLNVTPGAIVSSIDILTTGFDEPSVKCIIMNRSTLSLVLWIQVAGRGARPFEGKEWFTILDMGGNAVTHGDWCDARDWRDLFHNPPKPREKAGAPPVKECPNCEAIVAASAISCPYCGHIFPVKAIKYDAIPSELQLVTRNIDVEMLALEQENAGHKPYSTLYRIGTNLATQTKYKLGKRMMNDEVADQILELYHEKAKEWVALKSKKWNKFHQDLTRNHLFSQLAKSFHGWKHGNWEPDESRIVNAEPASLGTPAPLTYAQQIGGVKPLVGITPIKQDSIHLGTIPFDAVV
jgi:superfamily II DNA or RNA helicase